MNDTNSKTADRSRPNTATLPCALMMIWVANCGPIVAQDSAQKPVGASSDALPTTKIVLHPAALPVPALKYSLLPPAAERTPGNAATLYYRALLNVDYPAFDWQGYLEKPLAEMPGPEVREYLAKVASRLEEAHAAARRERCDWDLPIHGNRDLIALGLEELQRSRMLGAMLAYQTRLQMLDGRFDEAVHTLQTSFSLATHINEIPLAVPGLVAAGISNSAATRVLEMAQCPGSPNLYWALTTLPVPLIPPARALEVEGSMAYELFPFFRNSRRAEHTPKYWQELLVGMAQRLAPLGRPSLGLSKSELSQEAASLALTHWALKAYPLAKTHLLERGIALDRIAAMPIGEALAIYSADKHDEMRDEFLKWQNVPWPEANAGMAEVEKRIAAVMDTQPLVATFFPAFRKWLLEVRRVDRTVAELRVIEALRLYAATHDRHLPADLSAVTEVPVPLDPLTGKSFEYRLDGVIAVLDVLPLPGFAGAAQGKRYEITVAPRS